MQFALVEAEVGRAVFTCTPDESVYNPIGAVHGGLVCTLLDSAAGCALHTTLPQGKGYTSVEIKVNYLKAVRASSGLLTATGTVIKAGARVGFTEAVVTDGPARWSPPRAAPCWSSTCPRSWSRAPRSRPSADGSGPPGRRWRRACRPG